MTTTNFLTLSASSIIGDAVRNSRGEDLGKIEELMLDPQTGNIRYAVLSFGGFLGIGDKLFAIPWRKLRLDPANKCFVMDVTKERLEDADGFDKNDWPDFAEESFHTTTFGYWGETPDWAQ
jgi:sporulation protein YlmC with PRC-barrel domain